MKIKAVMFLVAATPQKAVPAVAIEPEEQGPGILPSLVVKQQPLATFLRDSTLVGSRLLQLKPSDIESLRTTYR